MREAFVHALVEAATADHRVMLLTGDLGYLALEPFAEKFPNRFYNVGVAEQNMVGLATGLAEAGFIPFVYSIVPFAVLRPLEFIRNGPILHQLPVRIVGVGGGFDYGPNGFTHYGLEDVAVLRSQHGIAVFAPADRLQTSAIIAKTHALPGPIYYRLGKNEPRVVPGLRGRFEPARLQVIEEGSDVCLISMGGVAIEVAAAMEQLQARGVKAGYAVLASVSPAPVEDLVAFLSDYRAVVTVEAHYVNGGLGSLVAEVISEHSLACRLCRAGVRTLPAGRTGSRAWLHDQHGLSAERLVKTALTEMERLHGK